MNQLVEATLEALLERIENGDGAWIKEWVGGGSPRNAATARHYRGVNILLLWAAKEKARFVTSEWATYKQWQSLGKQVAEGQKSSIIFITKDALKKGGDKEKEEDHYRLLKCAFVFNRAQLTEPPAPPAPPTTPAERHELCQATIDMTGARFRLDDHPAYHVTDDVIGLPHPAHFASLDAYYDTAFHELVHWSGHDSRLARGMGKGHHHRYAEEELIAEFGAAFLSAEHGITETNENNAAYIRSWLQQVKGDRAKALMMAASAASKAAEFILPPIIKREEEAA